MIRFVVIQFHLPVLTLLLMLLIALCRLSVASSICFQQLLQPFIGEDCNRCFCCLWEVSGRYSIGPSTLSSYYKCSKLPFSILSSDFMFNVKYLWETQDGSKQLTEFDRQALIHFTSSCQILSIVSSTSKNLVANIFFSRNYFSVMCTWFNVECLFQNPDRCVDIRLLSLVIGFNSFNNSLKLLVSSKLGDETESHSCPLRAYGPLLLWHISRVWAYISVLRQSSKRLSVRQLLLFHLSVLMFRRGLSPIQEVFVVKIFVKHLLYFLGRCRNHEF